MSNYDNLRKDFENASAREKLGAIRIEMLIPIEIIRGNATILKSKVTQGEIEEYVNSISKSADDLKLILDALTID